MHIIFEKYLKGSEDGKCYFRAKGFPAVAEGKLVNRLFLRLEQHISCVTITELCIPIFKFAMSNHFPHTPSKHSNRWKKMMLYVYVTTPKTKAEAATR